MFVAGIHATDINLLPFNGYIVGFEDGLDRFRDFGTNTIACWTEEGISWFDFTEGRGATSKVI